MRAAINAFGQIIFLKLFLPPSVRREVKGLSELLLLQHFSDIVIFWKFFKVSKTQRTIKVVVAVVVAAFSGC